MNEEKKYTVLGRAEAYREEVERSTGGDEPKLHRTFDEARALLLPQITVLREKIGGIRSDFRLDEVVAEVRLDHQWLAKSYHPYSFINQFELPLRGTGSWMQPVGTSPKLAKAKRPPKTMEVSSRSLFLSGTEGKFKDLEAVLRKGTTNRRLQKDIIKINEIRIPEPEDRLLLGSDQRTEPPFPLEVVLFNWDRRRRDAAIDRVLALMEGGKEEVDFLVRAYEGGPTFMAIQLGLDHIADLGQMNFLRVARPLERVRTGRAMVPILSPAPEPPKGALRPTHRIAVFDGGCHLPHPHLAHFVEHTDLTPKPANPRLVDHGTAVCGAALYGHIDPLSTLEEPTCGVLSFRVLPDSRNDRLELYGVIDALEAQIPKLPNDVRVVNLSIGPPGKIDAAPSRFTYAIDRLSYNHDKLFFVAVGNSGDEPGKERILAPSDSVNNIAVGAHTLDPVDAAAAVAAYSCTGPGRPGGYVKPDLLAFGGCDDVPFNVLAGDGKTLIGTSGTSVATPVASSRAGDLFARSHRVLSTQAVRALMIQSAAQRPHGWENHGWGILPVSTDEIVACTKQRVSVLFQGTVSPKENWKLPFLLPPGFHPKGKIFLNWTIVLTPEVDPGAIEEYTLAGITHQFRPNKYRYRFSPPKGSTNEKARVLDLRTDQNEISVLLGKGWTQSANPASAPNSPPKHESILRKEDAKWDTIVRGEKRMEGAAIEEPCLTISVFGRGEWQEEEAELLSARYAAVLTAEVPKYSGDLYAEVLAAYRQLVPMQLRTRLEVLVPISSQGSGTTLGKDSTIKP